jgi:hypothetical protein
MAYNINDKSKTGAKINRTPAPTSFNKSAGSYGMMGDSSPVSIVPGQGGPLSPLSKNLMESSDDGQGVLQKIIDGGVAGRDDRVPSDGNQQTRTISAQPYRSSWGMDKAPTAKLPGKK